MNQPTEVVFPKSPLLQLNVEESGPAFAHFYTALFGEGHRYQISARWKSSLRTLKDVKFGELVFHEVTRFRETIVARVDEGVLKVELGVFDGTVGITLVSPQYRERELLDKYKDQLPLEPAIPSNLINMNFWMHGSSGPRAIERQIHCPTWDDIQDNYASTTKKGLSSLMQDFKPKTGGQLLLWHGPPGTGKTYAIRSLLQAWKPWCSASYITDPEDFFGHASYMLNVLLDPAEDEEGNGEKWRLFILEDAGELMSADAQQRSGQGLSRLLNITDGMVGQGLRAMVLITTNEDVQNLHAAAARPGRCVSNIHFDKFSPGEALAWFNKKGRDVAGKTISAQTVAEAYAALEDEPQQIIVPKQKVAVGFGVN